MKPLSFSRPMVLARRAGRKTQTRRLVKPPSWWEGHTGAGGSAKQPFHYLASRDGSSIAECPYGRPGEQLWVREDFTILTYGRQRSTGSPFCSVHYNADGERGLELPLTEHEYSLLDARRFPYRATPGRFMYQSLARDRPTLLAVRVERLQDITEEDAIAEGIVPVPGYKADRTLFDCGVLTTRTGLPCCLLHDTAVSAFRHLWESIHGPDSWATNPYVWVLTLTPFTEAA